MPHGAPSQCVQASSLSQGRHPSSPPLHRTTPIALQWCPCRVHAGVDSLDITPSSPSPHVPPDVAHECGGGRGCAAPALRVRHPPRLGHAEPVGGCGWGRARSRLWVQPCEGQEPVCVGAAGQGLGGGWPVGGAVWCLWPIKSGSRANDVRGHAMPCHMPRRVLSRVCVFVRVGA